MSIEAETVSIGMSERDLEIGFTVNPTDTKPLGLCSREQISVIVAQ
jgi:hypothetical protein